MLSEYQSLPELITKTKLKEKKISEELAMKEFYLKKQKETIGNSITTNANTIKFST
jgi:hypothetical protein